MIILVSYGWEFLIATRSPYGSVLPLAPGKEATIGIPWFTILYRFPGVVFQLEIFRSPRFWDGILGNAFVHFWQAAMAMSLVALFTAHSARRVPGSIEGKVAISLILASASFIFLCRSTFWDSEFNLVIYYL